MTDDVKPISPSIIYTTYPLKVHRGAGADLSCHWVTGMVHPDRLPVCHRLTKRHRQPFTFTGDLNSPINLRHMSSDYGRKTMQPCKLHTDKSKLASGSEPTV